MNTSTASGTVEGAAPRRRRSTSDDLRERLIAAALVEFSENGFEGASTRAIAARADAHQPQINYHFESKEALWRAAVDRVMAEFDLVFAGIGVDVADAREAMAEIIRRLVHFAADHPELHRIMIQEGTTDTERVHWLVETHIRPRSELGLRFWEAAVADGVAAPVPPAMFHYLLIGSATLPFANSPEARLLLGVEPTDPAMVDEYAETLVAVLLPEEA